MPLRILVAPSGLKECLSPAQAAAAIAAGIRRVVPDAVVDEMPLADGGEGSAAALARASAGRLVPVTVTGPVGQPVDAHFALLGGDGPRTAMVEIAAAAGLALVPRDQRDPTLTTSFGVGELIAAALDQGVARILVGCGDSGICDGGAGALQALGARITDTMGEPVTPGGAGLVDVESIDVTGLDPRLAQVEILVAVNPYNVLCGENGVARVFGPQKGASDAQVERLSAAMARWAKVLERDLNADLRSTPGSGASGGLGAGLSAALGAKLLPRFDVLLGNLDPDAAIAAADLVITAEGTIDGQSARGKVPGEIGAIAARHGTPVVALAGTLGADADANYDAGISAIAGIAPGPMTLDQAIAEGEQHLRDASERLMRILQIGRGLA